MRQRRVAIIAASMIIVDAVVIIGMALSGIGQNGPPPTPTVPPDMVEIGLPFADGLPTVHNWVDRAVVGLEAHA